MSDKKKNLSEADKIDEILARSIANILPSKDGLREVLLSGKKMRIYIGADATGPQLHIGHATNFMLLEEFRKLGHEVIILFGDFTAMIGDPTDKSAARVLLTKKQVDENIKTWKEQVSKIVDFEDKNNPAKIVKNSEWLSALTFTELIDISANFTVQRMLERDMFQERIKDEKPIYLHEFFYPLMQGYDSVHLDVDMEIGGTDQTFNMLAGRTLQKKYHNKEKFVITTTLLSNPVTGEKLMSKSLGGFVALNDTPNDMFGKIMALSDEAIIQVFTDCTYVLMSEIKKMEADMKADKANPRDLKLKLAEEIVKIYHGEEEAKRARDYFINTFSKKETPENIPETVVDTDIIKLAEFLVLSGNAKSNSDARRKIEQGGVEIDGKKEIDWQKVLSKKDSGSTFKIGKHGFARIKFE